MNYIFPTLEKAIDFDPLTKKMTLTYDILL